MDHVQIFDYFCKFGQLVLVLSSKVCIPSTKHIELMRLIMLRMCVFLQYERQNIIYKSLARALKIVRKSMKWFFFVFIK